MLSLFIIGVVSLLLIIIFFIIIQNRPDFWFWLFINLFFDPGGYVEGYLGGNLFGPLNVSDIFFLGIILCLISTKIDSKIVFSDSFLTKFLLALSIFALYYFIIYGGVIPYLKNDFDYITFLIKNRIFAYSFIILIAVYVFTLKDLKYFYYITLSIGIICLSFYWITLFTGIQLVPLWEIPREGITGSIRIFLHSYGIFDLLFPFGMLVFLLRKEMKLNLKYKSLLYYTSVLMMLTMLMTLTRRVQISIIGTIIIIVLLVSYIFWQGKLQTTFKLLIPILFATVILSFSFPKYVNYILKLGENTILLLTTGSDSSGSGDYRVSGSGDLNITKQYIKDNLLFGTGYTYLYWGDEEDARAKSPRGPIYARAADAAYEVPIYYLLFGYGTVGAILVLPLYFFMLLLFFNLLKLLKLNWIYYLQNPLTVLVAMFILLTIASKFSYDIWTLSSDFTGIQISKTIVILGIGMALQRKMTLDLISK